MRDLDHREQPETEGTASESKAFCLVTKPSHFSPQCSLLSHGIRIHCAKFLCPILLLHSYSLSLPRCATLSETGIP